MTRNLLLLTAATLTPCFAQGQTVAIESGQTSVLLDTDTLSSAAGLTLSGVSAGVIAPGDLGAGSVAFPINSTTAATLPTTFAYTPGDFPGGPFSGSIEHTGSVLFNSDTVEVGDFTIGFDAARATGGNSGFFVESTTGVAAILFDTQVVALNAADDFLFDLEVDLVVSPEFATFLTDNSLASADLTGAAVGDARIIAGVPEPGTLALAAGLVAGVLAGRGRV